MIRKLTAMLALTGVIALTPLASAQDTLRTESVYNTIEYTLYGPAEVGDLNIEEATGLIFAFPEDAEVINTYLDEEDLIANIRYDDDLDDLADYYRELFEDQDALELVQDFNVNEERATAVYRYGEDALLRWTAERVREGVYRVVYNFERQ